MKPVPVGAVVDYRGSCTHGRYVITAHHDPAALFSRREMEQIAQAGGLAEHYPDGVAYEIWPEGMEVKFRNRDYMVYRVRRGSLTVVSCTREGFEPMTPFTEET